MFCYDFIVAIYHRLEKKKTYKFKFSMHRATLEQHLLGTLKEKRLEGKLSLGDQSV
jgi:hypothetical protein